MPGQRALHPLPYVCRLSYWRFEQMTMKEASGVCRPVSMTRVGAGGAYECFATERDSLQDLTSSFSGNRNV